MVIGAEIVAVEGMPVDRRLPYWGAQADKDWAGAVQAVLLQREVAEEVRAPSAPRSLLTPPSALRPTWPHGRRPWRAARFGPERPCERTAQVTLTIACVSDDGGGPTPCPGDNSLTTA